MRSFRFYFLPTRLKLTKTILLTLLIMCIVSITYNYYSIRLRQKILLQKIKPLKYILFWTNRYDYPLNKLMKANSVLVKGVLNYSNCYITYDRNFIDQADFDAVAFSGVDTGNYMNWLPRAKELPSVRSEKQKYIFSTDESPFYSPICTSVYDAFYNWTWTYRLDSDLIRPYFNIYDLNENIIGPSLNMKWLNKLDPINEELKTKLSNKSKTAAWFVTRCKSKGHRELYVERLQEELRVYNRTVDIYGRCGTLTCPKDDKASCFRKLEEDYFFYLSFENCLAEDYVTEKLLSALNNYVVPIVYGGANYSRFVPPGSYLDARKLGPKELARQMNAIISDRSKYHNFFRWRNHYKYVDTLDYAVEVRQLCEKLYDDEVSRKTVRYNFRVWWNEGRSNEICDLYPQN